MLLGPNSQKTDHPGYQEHQLSKAQGNVPILFENNETKPLEDLFFFNYGLNRCLFDSVQSYEFDRTIFRKIKANEVPQ